MTEPAIVGRRIPEALRLLKGHGVQDVRIEECLPPEDKRSDRGEMRVLRVKRVGETVVLTVSPFETEPFKM